ncbi:MAG TPA: VanZ family protein [Gemmatimonadales bacterium]|nr:VanZ family protein [Gemmatimonadales bacterium]
MTRVTPDVPGPRRRLAGRALVVLCLLAIAAATLTPEPELAGAVSSTPPWCLLCGDTGLVDALLNVVLFVPYGIALRAAGQSWRRIAIAVALTTLSIELLQMKVIAGRDASLGDLLTNFAGGLLGAWLAAQWRRLLAPDPRLAGRLALGGALAWLALTTLTGWLEEREVPAAHAALFFARELPAHDRFGGRVLGAEINGWPVDSGSVASAQALALGEDSARFGIALVSGRPPARPAPVAELLGGWPHATSYLALEQRGRDAVFRWRMRIERLRLRSPALRLPRAFPPVAGDTLLLTGAYRDERLWLTVQPAGAPAQARSIAVPLSPSWSWAIVLPFEYDFGPEVYVLTALWLAGLLFLPGYWAAWAGRGTRVALVGCIVGGLAGVPWLVTLPAVHWSEWLGALGGAAGGGLLGALVAARLRPRARRREAVVAALAR